MPSWIFNHRSQSMVIFHPPLIDANRAYFNFELGAHIFAGLHCKRPIYQYGENHLWTNQSLRQQEKRGDVFPNLNLHVVSSFQSSRGNGRWRLLLTRDHFSIWLESHPAYSINSPPKGKLLDPFCSYPIYHSTIHPCCSITYHAGTYVCPPATILGIHSW